MSKDFAVSPRAAVVTVGRYVTEGVGVVSGPRRICVDASTNCENPIGFENRYLPSWGKENSKVRTWEPGQPAPLTVEGYGRCRRCGPCLRWRQRVWARRALTETSYNPRTWFGTLTLRPERQAFYRNVARHRSAGAYPPVDFEAYNSEVKLSILAQVIGVEITKYIKRIREQTGAKVRYMLVAEAHESGDPHFHMLVHETEVAKVVRKTVLQSQWHEGYSAWKLADKGTAYYVCKYLAKCPGARVRASFRYGSMQENTDLIHSSEEREKTNDLPQTEQVMGTDLEGSCDGNLSR